MPVQINERSVREAVFGRDSYGLLLVFLLADYLIVSLDSSPRWGAVLRSVTISITVLFAIHTSGGHRHLQRFAQICVLLALAGGVAVVITDNQRVSSVSFLLLTALLVTTPVIILRNILPRETVDIETIFGAVDVYILLGLVFATLYIGIARQMTHPPFLAQPGPHNSSDYVYLSYVTLTTVGFGDLTPLSNVARTLVVLEALIGQIFLVVLVARLVSAYSAQARSTQRFFTRTPPAHPRRRRRGSAAADDQVGQEDEIDDQPEDQVEGGNPPTAPEDRGPDPPPEQERSGPSHPQ